MIRSLFRVLLHKGPFALIVALWYQAKILVYRAVPGKPFIKKRIYDFWMYLDPRDRGISRTLLLFGGREEDQRKILDEVLHEGMTIFDIGANIGSYVLMHRRLIGDTGHIIALEPSPENVDLLKRNISLNGLENVTVKLAAVSNEIGVREFSLSDASNLHSFHTGSDRNLKGTKIDVETTTVAALAAEYGAPDLLRMDVEGHEVEVINGMLDEIEQGEISPMILFEIHRRFYNPDHDLLEPLQRLFNCGYTLRYAASASSPGTKIVRDMGYQGGPEFRTDFLKRVIFENISNDDALKIIRETGGVRTMLLQKTA
jgi:FkbM family methyltransferase